MTATEVQSLDLKFGTAAAAQVEAWNAHDIDAIREVSTEDVEHHDGELEILGLDYLAGMAGRMFERNPDWGGRLTGLYIGGDDAVAVWELFEIRVGSDEFTEDHPLIEYDVLKLRDGRIASWTLYYHPETMPAFTRLADRADAEASLLERYATAWSSDDASAVADLCAAGTTRSDPVFAEYAESQDDIERYAAEWFGWYPDVSIELVQPIAEASYESPDLGGVFVVHLERDDEPCDVLMAVLLEANEDEQIVTERVYYDADSLITCGWAA